MTRAIALGMSLTEFLECDQRTLQIFMEGRTQALEFEVEQGWDYTRHLMAAVISSMCKATRPDQIITLKRDGKKVGLSGFEKQQLEDFNEALDEELLEEGEEVKIISMSELMQQLKNKAE